MEKKTSNIDEIRFGAAVLDRYYGATQHKNHLYADK